MKSNKKITIYQTSDLHGNIDAIIRISAFLKLKTREKQPFLYFDSGDLLGVGISGSALSKVLDQAGLTAMVPGNHDASLPHEVLSKILFSGSFEILGANLELGSSVFASPAMDVECNGIKVKVVGLGAENFENQNTDSKWTGKNGIEFLKQNPPSLPKDTLNILITHLGFDRDLIAAETFKDFHLLLGGHTHTLLFKPDTSKGVPIFHPGGYGAYINKIEVTMTSEGVFHIKGAPLKVDELPVKQNDLKQLRNLFRKGENKVSKVYMVMPGPVYEPKFKPNFFGTLTAYAMKNSTRAEGAFMNATALNPSFTDKYLKSTDLKGLFSFDDKIYIAELTYTDYLEINEIMKGDHYYFLHRYFDEHLLEEAHNNSGIIKVALTEFLKRGGMHAGTVYSLFKKRNIYDSGLKLTDCLVNVFENHPDWAEENLKKWLNSNK